MSLPKGLITGRTAKLPDSLPRSVLPATPGVPAPAARRGRGVRRKPGEMNKTEAAYAAHLEDLKYLGQVAWFACEALKFRLAEKTFYTPDFAVMLSDGTLECHEVKGHWEDDARVKIKVAASLFPIKFIAVKPVAKKAGGGWKREEF